MSDQPPQGSDPAHNEPSAVAEPVAAYPKSPDDESTPQDMASPQEPPTSIAAQVEATKRDQMAANDEGVGGIQGNKILEAPNSCQKNQPWRKWVPKDTDKDPSKPWVGYQPDPKNESAKPWVDWIESMGPTASFLDGAMSGNAGG